MANPFDIFNKDIIRVISKATGAVSKDCKVAFDPNKMNLYEMDVDVISGDIVERDLPNNRKETYEVLDVGYHSGLSAIPAHYILSLHKTTSPKPVNQTHTVVNFHGSNSRFYQNSNDNSVNTSLGDNNVFEAVRKVIKEAINDEQMLQLLAELEEAKGKDTFLTKYNSFIQSAANHMNIIAPFVPQLTAMLMHK